MTELESTVLGVIVRDGPLSAYAVRMVFANSLTPAWSSSTGSIYPVIRRLSASGLVQPSEQTDRRGRRDLVATAAGCAALEAWISDIGPEAAAATPDPIRTRAFFLSRLDPQARAGFVRRSIEATEAALAEAERLQEARRGVETDRWLRLAAEGVLHELRARLDWLQALAPVLADPEDLGPD